MSVIPTTCSHGTFDPDKGCNQCFDEALAVLDYELAKLDLEVAVLEYLLTLQPFSTDPVPLLFYGAEMQIHHGVDFKITQPDYIFTSNNIVFGGRYCLLHGEIHGYGCPGCEQEAELRLKSYYHEDDRGYETCRTHKIKYYWEDHCPKCIEEWEKEEEKARKEREKQWLKAQKQQKIHDILASVAQNATQPEKERKSKKVREQEKRAKAKAEAAAKKARKLANYTL